MIYFTAHTFKCVCHCRRAMFRVLGMYNFGAGTAIIYYSEVPNKQVSTPSRLKTLSSLPAGLLGTSEYKLF